jgi:hypothetical protein
MYGYDPSPPAKDSFTNSEKRFKTSGFKHKANKETGFK